MNIEEKEGLYHVHEEPIAREEADFIIQALIRETANSIYFEQLWVKKEGELFQLCCIPFFVDGISLFDWVTVKKTQDGNILLDEVVKRSGHTTFRLVFEEHKDQSVMKRIEELGAQWESLVTNSRLISVDSPTEEINKLLVEYLEPLVGNLLTDFGYNMNADGT